MENREGRRVPEVSFRVRESDAWKTVTTADLFAGKRVVLFALPGAYTPTCSSAHVPRYNELAPVFAANGIDDIICLSVNDTFVMNAWQADQQADAITFLPDGNGEFSAGMGGLVDKNELGFGKRSWRYAMVVNDGVIEKMFIEPEVPGDPYDVSDADTVLKWLASDAELPADVVMFTKFGCGHCERAREALRAAGLDWAEHRATPRTFRALPGTGTSPQIFIDGAQIGGADELEAWLAKRGVTASA